MQTIVVKPAARVHEAQPRAIGPVFAVRAFSPLRASPTRALLVAVALGSAPFAHAELPCTAPAGSTNCVAATELGDPDALEIRPQTDSVGLTLPQAGLSLELPASAEASADPATATDVKPDRPAVESSPTLDLPLRPTLDSVSTNPVAGRGGTGAFGGLGDVAPGLAPAARNFWQTLIANLHQGQHAISDRILTPLITWLDLGTSGPGVATAAVGGVEIDSLYNFALLATPSAETSHRDDANDDQVAQRVVGAPAGVPVDAYFAWLARNGLYADLSYRQGESIRGVLTGPQVSVKSAASGWSLETGYPLRTATGVVIEPQFNLSGAAVTLQQLSNFARQVEFDDSYSTQSRAGVQLRKLYDLGYGIRLTPSGSVNAVTRLQGGNNFLANDVRWNNPELNRSRLLLEGGLNAEVGRRTEFFGGMNYQDDGTDDSVGGEMGLRLQW